LTEARFSTTADKVKHPRYDYGAGVDTARWFYMYSGGFKQVNNLAPGSTIRRQPGGVPPAIDLGALPEE